MPRFPVSPQKEGELLRRMAALRVGESQFEEAYFRAGGGMNGVHLVHRPTGVRVRCGRERSQLLNRFCARRLLVEELEARVHGQTRHEAKAEKLREEKNRRARAHHARHPQPARAGFPALDGPAPGATTPDLTRWIAAMDAWLPRTLEA